MKNSKTIFILFLIVATISACKKSADSTVPAVQTGSMYLHLHTNVDSNEVDYDSVYVLTGGRKIAVQTAQLYLSNIQLVKADNSLYTVPNNLILKTQEVEVYLLGNVPIGNYVGIRFTVGLDSVTNLKTPTVSDVALNNPTMWYGSSAQPGGYIFVNFQGGIDTTLNATGKNLVPFMYMIGTNANQRQVIMPNQNHSVVAGQDEYIHIIIDYNKLLAGIPLNKGSNLMVMTPSDNTSSLAKAISNNIPSMFSYE